MPLEPIDRNKPLTRGDRVELHFKSSGMAWIKATQIVLLEQKFRGRDDWRITGWETPVEQPTLLIMRVEVLTGLRPEGETPGATGSWLISGLVVTGSAVLITCASIAGLVILAGVVYNLTLQETFLNWSEAAKEVVESPIGKVAVAGTGVGIAAIGILALMSLAKK